MTAINPSTIGESLSTANVNDSGVSAFVIVASWLILVFVVNNITGCFGDDEDCDDDSSDVGSFTVSSWNCLCNIFRPMDKLGVEDLRFGADTVKSMNISEAEEHTGKSYLPSGVDGAGHATKQYLDADCSLQQLPASSRQKLSDSRAIMKAYLISKLVSARYVFDDGHMEFDDPKDRRIALADYQLRTNHMYNLLYSGQVIVDTRATRRQQRTALKRLKKSNLNSKPSKIRALANQMKQEQELERSTAQTVNSSGLGCSTSDINDKSEALARPDTISKHSDTKTTQTTESRFSRFLTKIGLRSRESRESGIGSSLGSLDRLGGIAVIDVQETAGNQNWTKRQTSRLQPLHTYGGAQF